MRKMIIFSCFIAVLAGCGFSGRIGQELKPVWSVPLASIVEPKVVNGLVYIVGIRAGHPDEERRIFALDAATGKEIWVSKITLSAMIAGEKEWLMTNGVIYCFGRPLDHPDDAWKPMALDAMTGQEVWTSDAEAAGLSNAYLNEMDGEYLYLSGDGKTMALDAKTGKPAKLDNPSSVRATANGMRYFINSKAELVAVKDETGPPLWSAKVPNSNLSNYNAAWIRAVNDKVLAVVISLGSQTEIGKWRLSVHDVQTGKQLWAFDSPPDAKTVTLAGNTLYVTQSEFEKRIMDPGGETSYSVSTLYAFEALSGRQKWKVRPSGIILAKDEHTLYTSMFGSDNEGKTVNFAAGLDPETGKELWRHEQNLQGNWPAAVLGNGRLWFAFVDTKFNLRKEYTGDRRGSALRAGSIPENMHATSLRGVDPKTGSVEWESEVQQFTQTSDVILSGGMLFVATRSEMKEGTSSVRAFKVPETHP